MSQQSLHERVSTDLMERGGELEGKIAYFVSPGMQFSSSTRISGESETHLKHISFIFSFLRGSPPDMARWQWSWKKKRWESKFCPPTYSNGASRLEYTHILADLLFSVVTNGKRKDLKQFLMYKCRTRLVLNGKRRDKDVMNILLSVYLTLAEVKSLYIYRYRKKDGAVAEADAWLCSYSYMKALT